MDHWKQNKSVFTLLKISINHTSLSSKQVFKNAGVDIPIGETEIYTSDDLLVSLTRLITLNLDVPRWYIQLNYDYNNETVAVFDVSKISIIDSIRKEHKNIQAGTELDDIPDWVKHKSKKRHWMDKGVQVTI